ncbi:MAG: hypothetical protein ACI9G1_006109 [Pirellulaceae bacterium]|jgi:hypothetical protein
MVEKLQHTTFADVDADLIQEYKSLNVLAPVAFLISLVSPVALLNVFIGCVVAFPAIVLSLTTISSINKNSDTQTGKNLAIAGLLISSFFVAMGMGWHFSRTSTLTDIAKKCADQFIKHIEKGELYSAHQLMLHRHERRHPNVPFELFYEKNPVAKKNKESIQSRYPLSQLIAIIDSTEESSPAGESRSNVSFKYVGVSEVFEEMEWEVVILRYEMNYTEQSQNKTLPFDIMIGRQQTAEGQAEWKIQSVTSPVESK